MMKEHLCALQTSIRDYFPSISTAGVEWVILPFGTPSEHNINNASDLTFTRKNKFTDLSVDSTFRAKFLNSSIAPFWIHTPSEYPAITSKALSILLPFSTSYLCEAAFSTMKIMKTKHRTRLQSLSDEFV
jgi:hypothetical protein